MAKAPILPEGPTVESRDRSQTRFPRAAATVTVAELPARHAGPDAPVAPEAAEPDADETPPQAISVAALLRREGTGPHRADGQLVPRGHSRPAPAPAEASRRTVRKATAAAGVLFAASAVFGSALVDNAVRDRTPAEDEAGAPDGEGPGATEEALRAFGEQAAGTGVGADPGAPVDGVTLASVALLPAEAVRGSATSAPEDGDPPLASAGDAGQPTFRSRASPVGEASSAAGRRGGPAKGRARGGGAGGPRADPGAPGNGGPVSGGPAGGPDGGPGEQRGKGSGPR